MDIRTYLQQNILLFDGAMGTYFAAQGHSGPCELANLTAPETVYAIHRQYAEAGAMALKTNTFAANRPTLGPDRCLDVIDAAWVLAGKAAGDAFVFADLGPVSPDQGDPAVEYCFLADRFLALGAKHFLLETLSDDTGLHEAAAHIKARDPAAFLIASFAVQPDGFTCTGHLGADLLRACAADPNIDAAGFNCVSSAGHMAPLAEAAAAIPIPLSLMPNAGYPTVLGRRTIYQSDPEFFGQQIWTLAGHGARILGGCCGTTPAHIAAAAQALKTPPPKPVQVAAAAKTPPPHRKTPSGTRSATRRGSPWPWSWTRRRPPT